ncbi:hypothetical protein [Methylobacterium nigriterrae]|uniref:hypothetical protein n=1 Tax=Methylobacterium nigriterrae TaxID=3127512 RepID=UPI003013F705
MGMLGVFVLGLVVGSLFVLARPNLTHLTQRRECRNLTSALIGEIVALLDAVEAHAVVERLDAIGRGEQATLDRPAPLPMTIFSANADKLDRFSAPLPRKLAYFYTRLATLWGRVEALGAAPAAHQSLTAQEASVLSKGFKDTLDLADDILRQLRRGLAQHRLRVRFRREIISTLPAYRRFARPTLLHPFAKRPFVPRR